RVNSFDGEDFLGEFIELYKSFPCLWQVKNKDYKNKETVTRKINSLRTVYRKELKKVKASATSGTGEEDIYKPSLWYFDLLEFLSDQDIQHATRNYKR
uniref:Uncharacterized protein LOC114346252 n=1 Tax=Diabrotica virgifera virgifera TaxID=50390 RepID=A0A6P7H568_DIAVI